MSIQAGKENERKWEEYWGDLRSQRKYLPVKANGEVNVAQVGRDSKIGRENLYKNPNIYPKLIAAIEETLKAEGDAVRCRPESSAPSSGTAVGAPPDEDIGRPALNNCSTVDTSSRCNMFSPPRRKNSIRSLKALLRSA